MVLNDANWIAVLVSLVLAVVLGTVWYGPLFGKKWMKLMGISQKQMLEAKKKGPIKSGMAKSYIIMIISSLITICILTILIEMTGSTGAVAGAKVGLWIGLIIAAISTGTVGWEGKPWALWLINAGYHLINLALIGAILATWA